MSSNTDIYIYIYTFTYVHMHKECDGCVSKRPGPQDEKEFHGKHAPGRFLSRDDKARRHFPPSGRRRKHRDRGNASFAEAILKPSVRLRFLGLRDPVRESLQSQVSVEFIQPVPVVRRLFSEEFLECFPSSLFVDPCGEVFGGK